MSRTRPVAVFLIALIFFLAVLNAAAYYWHLYFHLWWLDIAMHLLGGFWIALTGLVCYYRSALPGEKDRSGAFVVAYALALTMTVGVLWEVFEFSVDRMTFAFAYRDIADTLSDLVNDFLGALIGALVFLRKKYHQQ